MRDAPEPVDALTQWAIGWLCELDVRAYLHPAVQAAIADSYEGAHRDGQVDPTHRPDAHTMLLPLAFGRNYDEYRLLVWRSNPAGAAAIADEFPQKALADGQALPTREELPPLIQALLDDIIEHRSSLPAVMRTNGLARWARIRKGLCAQAEIEPLSGSLGRQRRT